MKRATLKNESAQRTIYFKVNCALTDFQGACRSSGFVWIFLFCSKLHARYVNPQYTKMARLRSHHVVPHPEKGWAIKKDRSNHVIRRFDRKQDAVDKAREISRNQRTELFIHGKNNRIQRRDSHGNDPYPPQG